jgi:hypothetical protein
MDEEVDLLFLELVQPGPLSQIELVNKLQLLANRKLVCVNH